MKFCVLITACATLHVAAQIVDFDVQPSTVPQIVTYNSNVTYNCSVNSPDLTIDWLAKTPDNESFVTVESILNGIFVRPGPMYLSTLTIPIYENGIPNNTKVRCQYRIGGGQGSQSSTIGTIIIQGLLSAVALRARCSSSQERSVTITWDAPYSLNVTNSSHGTRYLVNMTSRDPYTLNAGSESITVPADLPLYNITVTPYNGPEDKCVYGNSSSITIRRCPGQTIPAEEVNISALCMDEKGVKKLHFKFNLSISQDCVVCQNHSYISATDATSMTLEPFIIIDQYVDFYSNIAVLNVTNSSSSPLKFGRTYSLTIHAEHSAGGSTTTGDLVISISNDIVNVNVKRNEDYVEVTTIFTSCSDASGAHTVLNNTDPSKGSCRDGLQVLNVGRDGTKALANFSSLPQGNYSLTVFALNSSGLLSENLNSIFTYPNQIEWNKNSTPTIDHTSVNTNISFEHSGSQIIARCNTTCSEAVLVLQELKNDDGIILFSGSTVRSLPDDHEVTFTGLKGSEYCISIYFLLNGSMIRATRHTASVGVPLLHSSGYLNSIIIGVTIPLGTVIIVIIIACFLFHYCRKNRRVKPYNEYVKTFTYQGRKKCLNWDTHGFRLHVPDGALPPDASEIVTTVKAVTTCQHSSPGNSELVSGVYSISAEPTFSKPVTLEIEHSCLVESSQNFFFGRCSKTELPYHFQRLEDGIFEENNDFAKINLEHFSIFAIFCCFPSPNRYLAGLYYSWFNTRKWCVYLVIIKDTRLLRKEVMKYFKEKQIYLSELSVEQKIKFEGDEINLGVPRGGKDIQEGWRLNSSTASIISKKDVDHYNGNSLLPHCQFSLTYSPGQPSSGASDLLYTLNLDGARAPKNYFEMILPPPDTKYHRNAGDVDITDYIATLPPDVRPLLDELLDWDNGVNKDLSEIACKMAEWEGKLAPHLELASIDIQDIKVKHPHDPSLWRREALKIWKNKRGLHATYRNLLKLFVKAGDANCARTTCDVLKRHSNG